MSCIFRIYGEDLDIDSLLSGSTLAADKVWKKGGRRILKDKFYVDSGASFVASNADLEEFDRQVTEAAKFLKLNQEEIKRFMALPGVENAELDFGVALNEGYVAQHSFFPPEFLKIVAEVGVGIGISHYACSSDD